MFGQAGGISGDESFGYFDSEDSFPCVLSVFFVNEIYVSVN
jgi:hypothetical protein